jgi:hypothetical protein
VELAQGISHFELGFEFEEVDGPEVPPLPSFFNIIGYG